MMCLFLKVLFDAIYMHNMCMNLAFDVDDLNIFFLLRVEICLLAILHSYSELYSKNSCYSRKLNTHSSCLILLSTKFCLPYDIQADVLAVIRFLIIWLD